MVLVGIVTDASSEKSVTKLLTYNNLINENNVIFIKDKNIDNIKNVHFDTIIINDKIKKMEELENLICNTKNIALNVDEDIEIENTDFSNLNIITYGFNSKASITISSVTDDDALICVQRNIMNSKGVIEVQDIKIDNNNNYDIYDLIIMLILFFLYLPTEERIHIKGIK